MICSVYKSELSPYHTTVRTQLFQDTCFSCSLLLPFNYANVVSHDSGLSNAAMINIDLQDLRVYNSHCLETGYSLCLQDSHNSFTSFYAC